MTKTWFRLGAGFLLACLASSLVWIVQTAFGIGPKLGYGKIVAGAAVLIVFYRGWRHMVERAGGRHDA